MAHEFEFKLKKLKEKEEEELAILKEKRIKQEEMIKKENERKTREKLLITLRKEKEILTTDLEKMKKKNFALEIESDSWEDARKKNFQDLKEAEKTLNDQLEKIWKGREIFCDETEKYIDEYGISSKWWKEQMSIVNDPQILKTCHLKKKRAKMDKETNEKIIYNLKKEIEELKEKIGKEEKEKESNDFLMKDLEMEKDYLLQETNLGEFKRVKENLESLNKRCSELTQLISQRENTSQFIRPVEPNFKIQNCFPTTFDQNNANEMLTTQGEKVNPSVPEPDFEMDRWPSKDFDVEPSNGQMETNDKKADSLGKKPNMKESRAEEPKTESFLFQMLDPTTVKAARANAKSRKLSSMRAQERNRHLQLSFNNFLSRFRD